MIEATLDCRENTFRHTAGLESSAIGGEGVSREQTHVAKKVRLTTCVGG